MIVLDIIWEVRRPGKTRYKPLTQAQCQAIEEDYQVQNNFFSFLHKNSFIGLTLNSRLDNVVLHYKP